MKKNNSWFTLIEIIIWILIFSIILIWSFQVLSHLWIARAKLMIKTDIEKKAFYFSEKLFEEIKSWWVIDYEEYFNRKVFNNGSPLYLSWHYVNNSWFWNEWNYYVCKSDSITDKMLQWIPWNYYNNWCISPTLNNLSTTQSWAKQRYWQYTLQFVDYNSDWIWNYDDNTNDDEFLGRWPEAFELDKNLTELYLISWDKKIRTYFRYSVKQDPNIDSSTYDCISWDSWKTYTWTWCLWTIEFLKLTWKDWWENHNATFTWAFDWKTDTWIINKRFSWETNVDPSNSVIAWTWATQEEKNKYWQSLFDDSINVENVKFLLFPNKDTSLTWKENNFSDTAPYLRLQMTLKPSWKSRKQIKGKIPEIPINMTISLSDILSN